MEFRELATFSRGSHASSSHCHLWAVRRQPALVSLARACLIQSYGSQARSVDGI